MPPKSPVSFSRCSANTFLNYRTWCVRNIRRSTVFLRSSTDKTRRRDWIRRRQPIRFMAGKDDRLKKARRSVITQFAKRRPTIYLETTMDVLKTISDKQLIRLMGEASASPRLRKNLNIHSDYDDPIQRLFNAMEPGTYVRPHRHARPNGWELMLAVRGAFSIISFDDKGTVLERIDLSAAGGDIAAEIPPYTWHAIVVLAPETVMFEVKPDRK